MREHALTGVTVLAVTKTIETLQIEPLLATGHRHFAENRVQEASEKWPQLRAAYPGVELHLIGALQTNKVRDALRLFDVIETLDRKKLILEFVKYKELLGKKQFYVQVNTGREPQKAGIYPEDADAFIAEARLCLPVTGLMCIPPVEEDPSPHFQLLTILARKHALANVSMGMSSDWQKAITAGATHIRLGSALFGARG